MITVSHLSKSFHLSKEAMKQQDDKKDPRQSGRLFQALKDVSFSCDKGQVLGLLGPNGAGKTTTLRILSSALKPDSGAIVINDVDIIKKPQEAKKKIGFLSTKTGLYNRLTAKENIEYFAKLHSMNPRQIKEYGEQLYQQLDIEAYLHRRVETLSSGMQQKVSIARSVIHQPEVLVLDEPTTGLDIMATEAILEFIDSQRSLGRPVIFSTHHLDEIAMLADKVAIIAQGTTCFSGTLEQLQQSTQCRDLRKAFMATLSMRGQHGTEPVTSQQVQPGEQ
ncbi:ATP-binding cassette domain-containing protein [Thalassomonas viridans]|uniref:ATP-binding cassette domain-containing protein n=1 Tax=Thalassomonas viridans TaxID=137584 RepID=A0AAE9Z8X0_9GAMM|nr:ATP-binding cassette domain-containing protein [Thalassomonas viridans]WDE07463.1 ATP-binding cassette domain-containing protein [Thalassomonas viridans]